VGINIGQPVEDNEHNSCYAISPDGKILAIGRAGALESDREVQFWELKTGVMLGALKPLKGGVIHPGNCADIRFTPDSKSLIVMTQPKVVDNRYEAEQLVTVWDATTSKRKSKFKAPRPVIANGGGFALSNTTLAIGTDNGGTSLWDLATGTGRELATGHVNPKSKGAGTYAVAIAPDGKVLATGGMDAQAKLWDTSSGKLLHTLVGHHDRVQLLAMTPDGKRRATFGQNWAIRLWDVVTGTDACPLPGHTFTVCNAALSPDGKVAVTAGWDNALKWWDADTGRELRSLTVSEGITAMTLSPEFKTVLVATAAGKLRTWDAVTGRETGSMNLPDGLNVESFTFAPDGKHLVAAAGPKVVVWEWPALKLARTIDLPKPAKKDDLPENSEHRCIGVAVSPDGKWLVTVARRPRCVEQEESLYYASEGGIVDVWEFATGKRVRRLAESTMSFRCGTFTADGRFVLTSTRGLIGGEARRESQASTCASLVGQRERRDDPGGRGP
jgi:WD40 repeat protein